MKLYIIDAIGPFFRGCSDKTINFSKAPFNDLETGGGIDAEKFRQIRNDFEIFINKAKGMGFNAISLDELSYLINFDLYQPELKRKIAAYQKEFMKLFKVAQDHGMKIFINTDIMYFNRELEAKTGNNPSRVIAILKEAFYMAFREFPLDGIICRVGENDGVDVKGEFKSKLAVKHPGILNKFIKETLPVFEKYGKQMIVRTWSIGANKMGDIMWNKKTFNRAFSDIVSDNFIISMKYGDTDFFRNLELNPLFFESKHNKIVELQAKREYEGFGVLPYYVGWEYAEYAREIKEAPNLIGMMVWCQTGGWSNWRTITFLENSSVWNELNTFASIRIFKDGFSPEKAMTDFFGNEDHLEFTGLYNKLSSSIFYLDLESDQKLYFGRVRIPPLVWIYWNHVTINLLTIGLYERLNASGNLVDVAELEKLRLLGKDLKIENIDFIYDSLKIFNVCRSVLLKKSNADELFGKLKIYKDKYPDSYEFLIDLPTKNSILVNFFMKLFVRKKAEYRKIDRLILSRPFRFILRRTSPLACRYLPAFVNKQAMGIESLLE